jgi:hypothetical protein
VLITNQEPAAAQRTASTHNLIIQGHVICDLALALGTDDCCTPGPSALPSAPGTALCVCVCVCRLFVWLRLRPACACDLLLQVAGNWYSY